MKKSKQIKRKLSFEKLSTVLKLRLKEVGATIISLHKDDGTGGKTIIETIECLTVVGRCYGVLNLN